MTKIENKDLNGVCNIPKDIFRFKKELYLLYVNNNNLFVRIYINMHKYFILSCIQFISYVFEYFYIFLKTQYI